MYIFDKALVEKRLTNYIWNKLFITAKEKKFLTNLLSITDVIVFGGVIRDFVYNNLRQVDHRDIDLVVVHLDDNVEQLLQRYLIKKNSFGGYKLIIDQKEIDLWKFSDTWGIKNKLPLWDSIPDYLPHTSFFNLNAITFSLKKQELILSDSFKEFFYDGVLDIEFVPNPLPSLCLVKTYEYLNKYPIRLSERLINYLLENFKKTDSNKLKDIQLKHYGEVKFKSKELLEFHKKLNQLNGKQNSRQYISLHLKD